MLKLSEIKVIKRKLTLTLFPTGREEFCSDQFKVLVVLVKILEVCQVETFF